MTHLSTWICAAALAFVLGCCAANLDGPDDLQAARDVAAAVAELGTAEQFIHPGETQ